MTLATRQAPVLRAGVIYSGDNGRRICVHCAGASALLTLAETRLGERTVTLVLSIILAVLASFLF